MKRLIENQRLMKLDTSITRVHLWRNLSRLYWTDVETGIFLEDWTNDVAIISYYGKPVSGWLLPDGSISLVSTRPKRYYRRTVDGFTHMGNLKKPYTISGIFPFFKCDQTGEWCFLDYDGTMRFAPVNFPERCDEHYRRQNKRECPVKRVPKRIQPRFRIRKIADGSFRGEIWFGRNIYHTADGETKEGLKQRLRRWWTNYKQSLRRQRKASPKETNETVLRLVGIGAKRDY